MKLRIVNCPDKDFKPFVERAVHFYGQSLMSKRLLDNINLKVKFNPKLNVCGFASVEDYNNSGKPREFLIEIHSWIGAKEIFKTLAHEMVHVKQFAYMETNDSLTRWKGAVVDPDNLDYYKHPWEIEAYGMDTGLFTNFAIKEKLWEIFEGIQDPTTPIEKKKLGWKQK
jgi:hypothetical protein